MSECKPNRSSIKQPGALSNTLAAVVALLGLICATTLTTLPAAAQHAAAPASDQRGIDQVADKAAALLNGGGTNKTNRSKPEPAPSRIAIVDRSSLWAPIPIRNMRPYNLLFLQFIPQKADVLLAGRNDFAIQLDIANNLLVPDEFQNGKFGSSVHEDNEYQRLRFSWRRGLSSREEVGMTTALLWRNGGILDALLSSYHSLFGLNGNGPDNSLGREHYRKYQSVLQVVDTGRNTTIRQGSAFGLGETNFEYKHRLTRTIGRSATALRLGIKLPTGNPRLLLGSGSVDAGGELLAQYGVGRDLSFFGSAGIVWMGAAHRIPGAQPHMVQGLMGIACHPNSRDSFVLQIDANSLAVRTGNRFADRAAVSATFGYRRKLSGHQSFYAAFSENGDLHNYSLPAFSDIGPDLTLSAGFEWH